MEEAIAAAEKAAKNAHKAMVLTVIAAMVAVAVLAIDNSIKRAIIVEAQKAKGLLDKIESIAEEVRSGATQAGEAGNVPGNPVHSGNGVVHDAAERKVLGKTEGAAGSTSPKRPARAQRGTAGDG